MLYNTSHVSSAIGILQMEHIILNYMSFFRYIQEFDNSSAFRKSFFVKYSSIKSINALLKTDSAAVKIIFLPNTRMASFEAVVVVTRLSVYILSHPSA